MTLREIYFVLRHIDVRQHNNYAMQAALHGRKVPLRNIPTSPGRNDNFNKEEDKIATRAMQRALRGQKFRKAPKIKRG